MKKFVALGIFVASCSPLSAKSDPAIKATVITNLPTTTSYIWEAKLRYRAHQPPATCYSFGCDVYIMEPIPSSVAAVQVIVRLLMPDGSINILGCLPMWHPVCRLPEEGSTVDAKFVDKLGQVRLTMPNPGKDGKSYQETYLVIGVLQPTVSVPDVKGGTDHP